MAAWVSSDSALEAFGTWSPEDAKEFSEFDQLEYVSIHAFVILIILNDH